MRADRSCAPFSDVTATSSATVPPLVRPPQTTNVSLGCTNFSCVLSRSTFSLFARTKPHTHPFPPQLLRPGEAFDPEVPELPSLLPESRFPCGVFRHSDVLASLRPLGLKGTLDWSGLVEVAASVEALRDEAKGSRLKAGAGGTNGAKSAVGGKDLREAKTTAARVRGRALLTYLDTHETRLFDLKQEASGFLQRMSQYVYADPAAEKRGRERLAALGRLMALSWVSKIHGYHRETL